MDGPSDTIRRRLDDGHTITCDVDDIEPASIGREAEAMDTRLLVVERAEEVIELRVVQRDGPEQSVEDGVDDRDRVGRLIGGVDAVARPDGGATEALRRLGRRRRSHRPIDRA